MWPRLPTTFCFFWDEIRLYSLKFIVLRCKLFFKKLKFFASFVFTLELFKVFFVYHFLLNKERRNNLENYWWSTEHMWWYPHSYFLIKLYTNVYAKALLARLWNTAFYVFTQYCFLFLISWLFAPKHLHFAQLFLHFSKIINNIFSFACFNLSWKCFMWINQYILTPFLLKNACLFLKTLFYTLQTRFSWTQIEPFWHSNDQG